MHYLRICRLLFLSVVCLFCPLATSGTISDPNFAESVVISDATNLGNNPASTDGQVNGITCMAWAPDGANRLYCTIKGRSNANAIIQVIRNGTLQSVPFYRFDSGVYTFNECGLESMCFHPDYASGTKQIYIYMTVSNSEQHILRFDETIDGNGNYVASGPPTVIITGIPSAGQNHNGGGMTIAPDQNGNGRFLYWACGNNGNGVNRGAGLDNTSLGSKMGRANLDGSVPNDGLNASGYIWAYGFRNPFTMTTQPSTRKVWVNIVGESYEQVFIPTPGAWMGTYTNENGNPPSDPTLASIQIVPIVKYRTGGTDSRTIASNGCSRSGSTVTYTTTSTHGFRKGEKITISGASPASFNGNVYVLSTPSATIFTATLAGADTSGGNGTATTQALGNCITGGAFNNKSAWPAAYQNNFFFGDYGSGRITRVQLNSDNSVKQVDSFLTGGGHITDCSFGPDGNLYYAVIDAGTIRKITYTAVSITTTTLPATTAGASYNQTLSATGGTTPYTWTISSGSLPGGLTLNSSSGAISGTPSAAGTFNFTVNVADSAGGSGQQALSILVNAAPAITTTSLPGGNVGIAYNQTLASTGGTSPRTWSVSAGTLPTGLTLNSSSGAISGTPTAANTFNFTIMLKDAVNVSTTKAYSVVIAAGNAAPAITSTPITTGNVGTPYSYDVNATGNPAAAFSLTVSPAGMSINSATGIISWTPTQAGSFNVTVKAANGITPDATQSFTITVTAYGIATRPAATPNLGLTITALPATLSATGVFTNLPNLTPASPLIPYTVNTPLWSDGAIKKRWAVVPGTTTIGFMPTGEWTFPGGTVLVKHFELNTDERNAAITKRLETRLLFIKNDGSVFGATYKWRADNSNADLLPDFLDENITITTSTGGTRTQTWHYPSQAECLQCHTSAAGGVLGLKTRQQNGTFTYPGTGVTDNQLRTWNHIGLFSPALNEANIAGYAKLSAVTDTTASLEQRARSYIDANCQQCHRPGGAPALFDARYDTPIGSQNIVNGPVNNNLGVTGAKVVKPRNLALSIMDLRTNTTDTTIRMPPLARNLIDTQAVSVIEQWINSLPTAPPVVSISSPANNSTFTSPASIPISASATDDGTVVKVEFFQNGTKLGEDTNGANGWSFTWTNVLNGTYSLTAVATDDSGNTTTSSAISVTVKVPIGTGTGLTGTYYNNNDFTGPSLTRVDSQVNFNWGTGSPDPTLGADNFSVRWVGQVQTQYSETYTFYTNTDDGVRLWVNGQLIIDKWVDQGPTEWSGTIALSAGQKYAIQMDYYENTGGASASLSWSSPSTAKALIPQTQLYPTALQNTAPAAPSALFAVAVSNTQIDLSWADNAGNESGYEVQRSLDGTNWLAPVALPANSTSYSDTSLTAATLYYFRVRAFNAAGGSAYAGPVNATTGSGSGIGGGGSGSIPSTGLRVNFQPAGSPVPEGYLIDSGAVFGDRGNGFSYGWNADNSSTTRDRNSPGSPDQRYDTLEHLQKPINPNAMWEAAVPNGTYSVHIVSGDPSNIDSVFKTNAEGVLTVNGTPTSTKRWFEGTQNVTVTDGRLTITNAAGAANNKICYIDIVPVTGRDATIDDLSPVFNTANAQSLAVVMSSASSQSTSIRAVISNIPKTTLTGQTLGVDIGGAVMVFTLDSKGHGMTKLGRSLVKFDHKGNTLISITMKGSWSEAWADGGVVRLQKGSVDLPFIIQFLGNTYGGSSQISFNGKSGHAKGK